MKNLIGKYLCKKRSIAVEDYELSGVLRVIDISQKDYKVKIRDFDQFNTSRYFITFTCNDETWTTIKMNLIANNYKSVYTLETRYFKL